MTTAVLWMKPIQVCFWNVIAAVKSSRFDHRGFVDVPDSGFIVFEMSVPWSNPPDLTTAVGFMKPIQDS